MGMSKKERETFAKLPERVAIYRGHNGKNPDGISWTLSQEKAKWFSKRYTGIHRVSSREVAKEEIVFYSNDRSEDECVVL